MNPIPAAFPFIIRYRRIQGSRLAPSARLPCWTAIKMASADGAATRTPIKIIKSIDITHSLAQLISTSGYAEMQNQCRAVTHRFWGVSDNALTTWPLNANNDLSNCQGFVEYTQPMSVNEPALALMIRRFKVTDAAVHALRLTFF